MHWDDVTWHWYYFSPVSPRHVCCWTLALKWSLLPTPVWAVRGCDWHTSSPSPKTSQTRLTLILYPLPGPNSPGVTLFRILSSVPNGEGDRPPPPQFWSVADLKGGGGIRRPPQGFDPLPTQRLPLCTIFRYPYLVMDPKFFLKAPSAQIYTNFESKFSKKCLKTP